MLTTAMTAIGSDFLANFSTGMMLMGLFTALLMTLDQTLVSALKQLCTFVQA
jgi:ethanolamine utilization microcompartment shell protein EutS